MKKILINLQMRWWVLIMCLAVGAAPAAAQGSRSADSLALLKIRTDNPTCADAQWNIDTSMNTWTNVHLDALGRVDSLFLGSDTLAIIGIQLPMLHGMSLKVKRILIDNNTFPKLVNLDFYGNDIYRNCIECGLTNVGKLNINSDSLTQLTLPFAPAATATFTRNSLKMDSLKVLTIERYAGISDRSIDSISITNLKLPVLTDLNLNTRKIYLDADTFPNLTNLDFSRGNYSPCSTCGLTNVAKLKIKADNLTQLTLLFPNTGSAILTGSTFQIESLQSLLIWGGNSRYNNQYVENVSITDVKLPVLTALNLNTRTVSLNRDSFPLLTNLNFYGGDNTHNCNTCGLTNVAQFRIKADNLTQLTLPFVNQYQVSAANLTRSNFQVDNLQSLTIIGYNRMNVYMDSVSMTDLKLPTLTALNLNTKKIYFDKDTFPNLPTINFYAGDASRNCSYCGLTNVGKLNLKADLLTQLTLPFENKYQVTTASLTGSTFQINSLQSLSIIGYDRDNSFFDSLSMTNVRFPVLTGFQLNAKKIYLDQDTFPLLNNLSFYSNSNMCSSCGLTNVGKLILTAPNLTQLTLPFENRYRVTTASLTGSTFQINSLQSLSIIGYDRDNSFFDSLSMTNVRFPVLTGFQLNAKKIYLDQDTFPLLNNLSFYSNSNMCSSCGLTNVGKLILTAPNLTQLTLPFANGYGHQPKPF